MANTGMDANGRITSYEGVVAAKSTYGGKLPDIIPSLVFSKYKSTEANITNTGLKGENSTPTDIYPEDFFNVDNPQSTYIEIDIKTKEGEGGWKRLMAGQNSFFKDLKIEDNGGAKKFTLSLYDRDFFNLEELIASTIAFSQTSFNKEDIGTTYSKEPLAITNELTPDQKDLVYKKKKEFLDKIFKPQLIGGGLQTRYKWDDKSVIPGGYNERANRMLAICGVYVSIYNRIRNTTGNKFDNNTNPMFFYDSERGMGISYFENQFDGKGNDINNKFYGMSLSHVLDFWNDFMFHVANPSLSKCASKSALPYKEYSSITGEGYLNIKREMDDALNTEKSFLESNKNQALASNNLIELVQSKKEIEANLRIRFGYTDYNGGGNAEGSGARFNEDIDANYMKITSENTNISWANRLKQIKPRIRGPFYEFLITGVQSRIAKEGLYYTLTGFSVSSLRFDKFKLVQKFAKLKGTPNQILAGLFITFNEKLKEKEAAGRSPIVLLMEPSAYDYITSYSSTTEAKDGTAEVEVALGTESCIGKTNSYKSLRSLFNDVCAVFPRKVKHTDAAESVKIPTSEDGNLGEIEKTPSNDIYPLSYVIRDCKEYTHPDGTVYKNALEVIFYYKEPTKFPYCRVYEWGLTRNTIVKDIEINNKNEYASLASFSIYDKAEKKLTVKDFNNVDAGSNLTATNYTSDFILTNQVAENPSSGARTRLKNAINDALLNSLYEGSITIPGDPYYMFDDNMVPYCYPIKINVWRPSGGNQGVENGRIDSQGKSKLSYVSGYYVITSITHSIGTSGFTTTLGIMKYPGIEDSLEELKVK